MAQRSCPGSLGSTCLLADVYETLSDEPCYSSFLHGCADTKRGDNGEDYSTFDGSEDFIK